MTRKEFIAMVAISPLAVLFGKTNKIKPVSGDTYTTYHSGNINNTFDSYMVCDGRIWSFNRGFLNG